MRTMRTADGVEITHGLRVMNSDMRVGAVVLDDPRHAPWEEAGECWFYMAVDGRDRDRPDLVSESRVTTRHPVTRAKVD